MKYRGDYRTKYAFDADIGSHTQIPRIPRSVYVPGVFPTQTSAPSNARIRQISVYTSNIHRLCTALTHDPVSLRRASGPRRPTDVFAKYTRTFPTVYNDIHTVSVRKPSVYIRIQFVTLYAREKHPYLYVGYTPHTKPLRTLSVITVYLRDNSVK